MLTAVTLLVMAVAPVGPVPEGAASWGWSFELKGGVAGCSAVLVKNPNPTARAATPANPWLLTAFHCLDRNTPSEATNRSGQTIRLECDAKKGAGPPCGAYAFHLEGKDISAIEVRPDMLAKGTKLTPATIAAGSGQLYVFGWSAGFRRIAVGTAPRAANCDVEKALEFEVKGRLLYVTGSQCVKEGDSGGAVATNGGKVIGLVRAKDATRVDVIELIGASAKPVPAFLRAMFGPCANAGWTKDACVKALEGLKGESSPPDLGSSTR